LLHPRHRRYERLSDATVELVDEMTQALGERGELVGVRPEHLTYADHEAIGLTGELGAEPAPQRALRLLGALEERLDVRDLARRAGRRLDVRLDLKRADGRLRLEAH